MSTWTEFRGIVFIECMGEFPEPFESQESYMERVQKHRKEKVQPVLESQFGYVRKYGEFPAGAYCTPDGSEGSVGYEYKAENNTVVICGNVRDFGENKSDFDSILEWVKRFIQPQEILYKVSNIVLQVVCREQVFLYIYDDRNMDLKVINSVATCKNPCVF